jgi:hypothetical protein
MKARPAAARARTMFAMPPSQSSSSGVPTTGSLRADRTTAMAALQSTPNTRQTIAMEFCQAFSGCVSDLAPAGRVATADFFLAPRAHFFWATTRTDHIKLKPSRNPTIMGTHCLVGIQRANGTVDYIYVHYDGYLFGVGKRLLLHFDTADKVVALIEGGDRTTVLEEPEEQDRRPFQTTLDEFSFYRQADGGQGGSLYQYYYLFQENEWQFHTPDYTPLRDLVPAIQPE